MLKERLDDGEGSSRRLLVLAVRRRGRCRCSSVTSITIGTTCTHINNNQFALKRSSASSKKWQGFLLLYLIGLLFFTFGDAAADSTAARTRSASSNTSPKKKLSYIRRVTDHQHRSQHSRSNQQQDENDPHHQHQQLGPKASYYISSHYKLPVASLEIPLFAKSGTHHATIFAGHPPVVLNLIVDTGSRLTAWLCHDRQPKPQQRQQQRQQISTRSNNTKIQRYDPAHSTTALPISCRQGCVFQDSSKCGAVHNNNEYTINDKDNDNDNDRCIVRQRYKEGSSWTAYEVSDVISLPTTTHADKDGVELSHSYAYEASIPSTVPFTFGCQTHITGLFKKQFADGILGLERYSHVSLPQTLHQHGVTHSSAFSLCLGHSTGSLGLGGAQPHRHWEPMQLTPLRESSIVHKNSSKTVTGMYSVTVEEVWLGDTCLASKHFHLHEDDILDAFHSGTGTILDSGTTDTYLPQAVAGALQTAWLEQTGRSLLQTLHQSRSATYTRQQFDRLPALRLVLTGNVNLTVPAANYMEGASVFFQQDNSQQLQQTLATGSNSTTREYVLKNRLYTDQPTDSGAVLGINAMVGYDILYDSARGLIGFARANCEDETSTIE